MNSLSETIRSNINALVGRGKEISQIELARRVKMDGTQLNKILTGAQETFPLELLEAVARELNRDVSYFIGGTANATMKEKDLFLACVTVLTEIHAKHLPNALLYLERLAEKGSDAEAKSSKRGPA